LDLRVSCLGQPSRPISGPHLQTLAVSHNLESCGFPRMENADPIQEPFKFSRPEPVLGLVVMQPLYVHHRAAQLPLLFIAF
jgi:hypothetical protein